MSEDSITVGKALKNGDLCTRLSAVLMGAGLLGHRQVVKGILIFFYKEDKSSKTKEKQP